DLSYYATLSDKRARLAQLEEKFSFPLEFRAINTLNLDPDQMARLRRDEVVILLQDTNTSKSNSSIKVVVPSEINDMAILIGPVPLFNWFPLNLIVSMILISMFLISVGVYARIFPLQRNLQRRQVGVSESRRGRYDTMITGM